MRAPLIDLRCVPDGMKLGSHRGTAHALCCDHEASYPHEFRAEGQVGQESHRRPAVVEPAALRSGTFRDVRERR